MKNVAHLVANKNRKNSLLKIIILTEFIITKQKKYFFFKLLLQIMLKCNLDYLVSLDQQLR